VLNNDDKILPASDDVKYDHDDGNDEYNDSDGIPWHHMQLYRLYGDEADYFLHPMPVKTEKHVSIKPSKLLKKLCGECSPDTIGRKSMFTFFIIFDRTVVQLRSTCGGTFWACKIKTTHNYNASSIVNVWNSLPDMVCVTN